MCFSVFRPADHRTELNQWRRRDNDAKDNDWPGTGELVLSEQQQANPVPDWIFLVFTPFHLSLVAAWHLNAFFSYYVASSPARADITYELLYAGVDICMCRACPFCWSLVMPNKDDDGTSLCFCLCALIWASYYYYYTIYVFSLHFNSFTLLLFCIWFCCCFGGCPSLSGSISFSYVSLLAVLIVFCCFIDRHHTTLCIAENFLQLWLPFALCDRCTVVQLTTYAQIFEERKREGEREW